ncbi:MAG: DUF2911 domain-containing protein [Bryobacteraceae bacterium]|nr:DUF2911 domain-containing protein [Bryobacteraceae bacterium]
MQRKTFLCLTVVALTAGAVLAQRPRVSPHETVTATLGGKKVTIDYGRPYLKGRKAVGGQLVPFGKVWRTGADEATKLTTEADLMIGNVSVPAGSYALFTLPEEKGWTLIVNKTADQWGAFKYDEKMDVGRTPMKATSLSAPVEQFTIEMKPQGANAANLVMRWENTEISAPVKAK